MARTEARIQAAIWSNAEFRVLRATAQRLYMLLLSQPGLSLCGVIPYTARRWSALAPDTTVEDVVEDVNVLVKSRFVLVDADTEELWVRTFIRHDRVLGQPNIVKAMARSVMTVTSPMILEGIWLELGEGFFEGLREGFPKAFPEGFPYGFGEGFAKAFEERFAKGSSKGSGKGSPKPSRAHARAASVLRPTSNDPRSPASGPPPLSAPDPALEDPGQGQPSAGQPSAAGDAGDGIRKVNGVEVNRLGQPRPERRCQAPFSGLRMNHKPWPDDLIDYHRQKWEAQEAEYDEWHREALAEWESPVDPKAPSDLVDICVEGLRWGERRRAEAESVVLWAVGELDDGFVAETLDSLALQDQPPRQARLLASLIAGRALERDIQMEPWHLGPRQVRLDEQ